MYPSDANRTGMLVPAPSGVTWNIVLAMQSDNNTAAERARIRSEYRRRAAALPPDLYADWQPWVRLMVAERTRVAARLLASAGTFPHAGDACLEVGCGTRGWLSTLRQWGVAEPDLHGIDLDELRLAEARAAFPTADLRFGDATELPWANGTFPLVVASTVFTSVLDHAVRRKLAHGIVRVLAPKGALLWYDFAHDNPRNPNVRKVDRRELRDLFPGLKGEVARVTLAPPLARAVAPRSLALARLLSRLPFLRTHLLAVLVKR